MKACAILKNKKGSSSIMVMLIMIVLVVFGVLALMSSYSDFKLAKKSAAWHAKYYELDAKGEEFVSMVNAKLITAAKAVTKNDDASYEKLVKTKLTKMVKEYKIKILDSKEGLIVNAIVQDVDQNKLGISLIVDKLSNRNNENNNTNTNTNVNVSNSNNGNTNANVSGSGSDIDSDIDSDNNVANTSSGKYKYYRVAEWKQLPKEFKYEGQNDLWNGEVTNP